MIGWLARANPQESLHKIRWGHPGSKMPSAVADHGLSDDDTVQILRYFAEAQGQELEVTWVDAFGELIPMIERGEGDIASATMTVTPEPSRS